MKKIIILITYLTCFYGAEAGRIDSVETVLAQTQDTLKIPVLHELVVAYSDTSVYKSILYGMEAVELSKKCKDRQKLADAYQDLSIAYSFVSGYAKMSENLIKALSIQHEIGDSLGIAYSSNNLGGVFSALGDYEKALEYYNASLEIKESLKDTIGMANTLNNIGLIYYDKLKDADKAEEYISKAETFNRSIKQHNGLCLSYSHMSQIYNLKGDFNKALEYGKFALSLARDSNYNHLIIRIEANLGDIYSNLEDYKKASEKYKQSLQYAIEDSSKYSMMSNYKKLSEVYKKIDSISTANEYLLKYYQTKDEIFQVETNKKIIESEINFKIDLAQKENELLKTEKEMLAIKNREQFIYFISGGAIALIIIIFLIIRYRSNKKALSRVNKKNKIIEEMNIELQRLNEETMDQKEELAALFEDLSQREKRLTQFIAIKDIFNSVLSRDIRNPLQSIILDSYMLMKNQKEMKPEIRDNHIVSINKSINQIVELLDNLMQWDKIRIGDFEYLPVQVDLKKMTDDIVGNISNKTVNKSLKLINMVSAGHNLNTDYNMLYFVLKNIISNSVNFSEKGEIKIKSTLKKEKVQIEISDNGLPMVEDAMNIIKNPDDHNISFANNSKRGTGIDLVVSSEYLKILNGTFEYSDNDDKGIVFIITLPIKIMKID